MTSTPATSMPPADLRERVSGTADATHFDTSGRRTVDEWSRALAEAGYGLGGFARIVDFGCGCGRALRFLPDRLAVGQSLVGLDTDADAIRWLAANMQGVTVHAVDPLPPTPLASASAHLVLSHSVFTHLPEGVQLSWLEEIHRFLAPGGVLVASFHGRKAFSDYVASLAGLPKGDTLRTAADALDAVGFYHAPGRTEAERSYPAYYGAAFHTIGYVARTWLRWFDLVAWYPTFALNLQDVVVMRSKHAA